MPPKKIFNKKSLLPLRQNLRNDPTPFEKTLWNHLKNNQLNNHKFRRQHGIGNYIVDFYCAQEKLVVEVDGDSHFVGGAVVRDLERTRFFESLGIRVLRFTNLEVRESLEGVLREIAGRFRGTNKDWVCE